jgi:hypothetical protein
LKRRIVICIFLIWTLIKWSEQYILYAHTIFYISRAIKKSSKQRHIIVCFSVLSISSAFTIWTYFINEWLPRRNFKKRTILDTCINCKTNLMYILRAIAMLFLRAKVIPVNPQIHTNVMRPLCVLIFIFYFLNHCLYMYPI